MAGPIPHHHHPSNYDAPSEPPINSFNNVGEIASSYNPQVSMMQRGPYSSGDNHSSQKYRWKWLLKGMNSFSTCAMLYDCYLFPFCISVAFVLLIIILLFFISIKKRNWDQQSDDSLLYFLCAASRVPGSFKFVCLNNNLNSFSCLPSFSPVNRSGIAGSR